MIHTLKLHSPAFSSSLNTRQSFERRRIPSNSCSLHGITRSARFFLNLKTLYMLILKSGRLIFKIMMRKQILKIQHE
ncbi:hypothetical protein NECAME_02184 [Necator americanus]|uniref:Uncharacterized protein n=1 Tax=Necator americanus TaxID=51031 RepID=W2TJE0_NECAM|nr:hypothetical protein NECAME_02184 [Necator americanus]ETN81142.1 hypothetical protein NECAME_02184 [Necator americanus]